jgi:hypothetical protein
MPADPSMPSDDHPAIRTFSGTHDYHPSVLNDTDAPVEGNADDINWDIEHGRCPRCEGPLLLKPDTKPPGSSITQCRTIPICQRCGEDEIYEDWDANHGIGWGRSPASCWPRPVKEIEERMERWHSQAVVGIPTADGQVISEYGAAPVIIPRNTGGWAQYGTAEEPLIDDE